MRRAFLGGFLGSLLQPIVTRYGLKALGYLLVGAAVLGRLAWVWYDRQALWVQVLVVCAVAALLLRAPLWRAVRRQPVVTSERVPLDEQVTFLYRWYDADERLLYVGISNDLARRTGQHIADKPWMVEAVQCVATSYPNRAAALEAEEHAIYREAPIHNVIHNRGSVW